MSIKIQYERGCLVCVFKQSFSVFKQYFTHFNTLFHPHVFSQIFLNNNFQFLITRTKRTQNLLPSIQLTKKKKKKTYICLVTQCKNLVELPPPISRPLSAASHLPIRDQHHCSSENRRSSFCSATMFYFSKMYL